MTVKAKPLPANAAQLTGVLSALPEKDQSFAKSLLQNIARYGSATPKQDYWINTLIERATNAALGIAPAQAPEAQVGSFGKVYALFAKAKQNLKFPKLRLAIGNQPVVLALSGEKAKVKGVINVTDGGPYGANKWYGRVSEDGTWKQGFGSFPELPKVAELLQRLGESPEDTAAEYGLLTGYCCFCNRKLTDEKSTAVGFGSTCASQWGLSAQWKGAKGLFTSKVGA